MNAYFHVTHRIIRRMLLATLVSCVFFQWGCASKPFRFFVTFDKAPRLKTGSEVRYLGLKVGKVEKISIQQGEGASKPTVSVAVALLDRRVRVRRDDRFQTGTLGLLGEEYLDITPGAPTSALVPDGATVHGERTSFDLTKTSVLLDLLHLVARLSSLPEQKRDDLLKTCNRLLDEADAQASSHKPQDLRNP